MAVQYWVGDFFVDLTRNQVTRFSHTQTLPPKALAVLTCLAKHANTVVSQDELLSQVWPNTVVTPNTLQRSIAQLRKALTESGAQHTLIKTHAKQGYSLESTVRWQTEVNAQSDCKQVQPDTTSSSESVTTALNHTASVQDQTSTVSAKKYWPHILFTLSLVILIVVILKLAHLNHTFKSPTSALAIAQIHSLTATDNKEYGGLYSPDGDYIVFQRYSEKYCMSHIWAKDTRSQRESQLTRHLGTYGSQHFSQDGKALIFIKTNDCSNPVTQKKCYQLMSLDFAEARHNPQTPKVLMECKHSKIKKPMWLNDNRIVMLQAFSGQWKLMRFSIEENLSKVLYEVDEGNIIDFDYSVKYNLIAITRIEKNHQHYLDIIQPNGHIVSSHAIEFNENIAKNRLVYPNFTQQKDQLIFSTGRLLFLLSYDGQITHINLPLDEPMSSPVTHPNGKQMIAIKGHYDSDIAIAPRTQLPLSNRAHTPLSKPQHYQIIERSIHEDDDAHFQPKGDLIVFKSKRSGDQQIWLSGSDGARPLTSLPTDSFIYGMNWAENGESIMANINGELTQVYLNGQSVTYPFIYPIVELLQWHSTTNQALILARVDGISKLITLDVANSEFHIVTEQSVNWAGLSKSGHVIYTDHMDRYWQQAPAENQLIESLTDQGSDKRFIVKGDTLYGVNEHFKLWSFDLHTQQVTQLAKVPNSIEYLTDINETHVLFSIHIASKKELVELIIE